MKAHVDGVAADPDHDCYANFPGGQPTTTEAVACGIMAKRMAEKGRAIVGATTDGDVHSGLSMQEGVAAFCNTQEETNQEQGLLCAAQLLRGVANKVSVKLQLIQIY